MVLQDLKEGKNIALISDAGTPGISDPGQQLIQQCRHQSIPVTSLPGACAPIVALSLSGFEMDRFQFLGFLSKKVSERKNSLIDAFFYQGVSIFFESPQRIHQTLKEIAELGPEHEVAVVRELTKFYEECLKGKAADLLNSDIRGEVVLLIRGYAKIEFTLSPVEHVAQLQEEFSLSKHEAIKLAADLRGTSKKKDLYRNHLKKRGYLYLRNYFIFDDFCAAPKSIFEGNVKVTWLKKSATEMPKRAGIEFFLKYRYPHIIPTDGSGSRYRQFPCEGSIF